MQSSPDFTSCVAVNKANSATSRYDDEVLGLFLYLHHGMRCCVNFLEI